MFFVGWCWRERGAKLEFEKLERVTANAAFTRPKVLGLGSFVALQHWKRRVYSSS